MKKLLIMKKQTMKHFYSLGEYEKIGTIGQLSLIVYMCISPTEKSKENYFRKNFNCETFKKHLNRVIPITILGRNDIVTWANEYQMQNINCKEPFVISYNINLTVPEEIKNKQEIEDFYLQIINKIDKLSILESKYYTINPYMIKRSKKHGI